MNDDWCRCIFFALVASALLVTCLIVASGLMPGPVNDTEPVNTRAQGPKPASGFCISDACNKTANIIKQSLAAEQVDPCDDFYKFACGGWMSKYKGTGRSPFSDLDSKTNVVFNEILNESNSIDDSNALNATRNMYRACMNTAQLEKLGVRPLINLLKSFDGLAGWPMVTSDWSQTSFNISKAIVAMTKELDAPLFFTFNFIGNQTVIDLPSVDKLNQTYIIESAKVIRDDMAAKTKVSDSMINDQVNAVIRFVQKSSQIVANASKQSKQINKINNSADNLLAHARIDLRYIIKELDRNSSTTKINYVDYLAQLKQHLNDTDPKVIANYIGWLIVDKLGSHTNEKMFKLSSAYTHQQKRADSCKSFIRNSQLLNYALSRRFLDKILGPAAEEKLKIITENVKHAFEQNLDDAKWLGVDVKAAKEKLQTIHEEIAEPRWVHDSEEFNGFFKDLNISTDQHMNNVKNYYKFAKTKQIANEALLNPLTVNAYYFTNKLEIYIPAAIAHLPLYADGRCAANNYGGIGSIIGHEFTHGFDKSSMQGKRWLSSSDREFGLRCECIRDQYSKYPLINTTKEKHLDSNSSLNDDIADNGGVRHVYRAYRNYIEQLGQEEAPMVDLKRFTGNQMFFIQYAQIWCEAQTQQLTSNSLKGKSHSPGRYRATIPLSNMKEFADAFNCPIGSKMNPENKCVVW